MHPRTCKGGGPGRGRPRPPSSGAPQRGSRDGQIGKAGGLRRGRHHVRLPGRRAAAERRRRRCRAAAVWPREPRDRAEQDRRARAQGGLIRPEVGLVGGPIDGVQPLLHNIYISEYICENCPAELLTSFRSAGLRQETEHTAHDGGKV